MKTKRAKPASVLPHSWFRAAVAFNSAAVGDHRERAGNMPPCATAGLRLDIPAADKQYAVLSCADDAALSSDPDWSERPDSHFFYSPTCPSPNNFGHQSAPTVTSEPPLSPRSHLRLDRLLVDTIDAFLSTDGPVMQRFPPVFVLPEGHPEVEIHSPSHLGKRKLDYSDATEPNASPTSASWNEWGGDLEYDDSSASDGIILCVHASMDPAVKWRVDKFACIGDSGTFPANQGDCNSTICLNSSMSTNMFL